MSKTAWTASALVLLALLGFATWRLTRGDNSELAPVDTSPSPRARTGIVHAVNYPLQYFAQRVAGDEYRVLFLAPIEGDPALWRPDEETLAAIEQADLLLQNGAGYAPWTERLELPKSLRIDSSRAFAERYLERGDGRPDYRVWLDPAQAALQAEALADAFRRLDPEKSSQFDANLQELLDDLNTLDESLSRLSAAAKTTPSLLSARPVYGYLARRYGWNLKSMQWKPGEEPGEAEWKALSKTLDARPAKWLLLDAPPSEEVTEKLKKIGLDAIFFDPCGNEPFAGDYLDAMRENIENLRPAFDEQNKW